MAESYNTNLLNVATTYVKELGLHVTKTSLAESLKENPYFPSLYSLSSVFDKFNITHAAFRLTTDDFLSGFRA